MGKEAKLCSIDEIARKLKENFPEILDPTILRSVKLKEFLKKIGITQDMGNETLLLIKMKWAEKIFNESSSEF